MLATLILFFNFSTSLIPTDSGSGYRHPKARLGRKHVRPWKWMPFTNSAREVNHLMVLKYRIAGLFLWPQIFHF